MVKWKILIFLGILLIWCESSMIYDLITLIDHNPICNDLNDCFNMSTFDNLDLSKAKLSEYVLVCYVSVEILSYSIYTTYFDALFAGIHGISFILISPSVSDSGFNANSDKRWNKITETALFLSSLPNYVKGIALIDADLVILDLIFNIKSLLDSVPKEKHILMCEDAVDIGNSGFMIIRNTVQSIDFFRRWEETRAQVDGVDQHVLNKLLSQNTISDMVELFPPSRFNSVFPAMQTHGFTSAVLHLLGETTEFRTVVFKWMFTEFQDILADMDIVFNDGHFEELEFEGQNECCLRVLSRMDVEMDSVNNDNNCRCHIGSLIGLDKDVLQYKYLSLWRNRRANALNILRTSLTASSPNEASMQKEEEDEVMSALGVALDATGTLCDQVKNGINIYMADPTNGDGGGKFIDKRKECFDYYAEFAEYMETALAQPWTPSNKIQAMKLNLLGQINLLWFHDITREASVDVGIRYFESARNVAWRLLLDLTQLLDPKSSFKTRASVSLSVCQMTVLLQFLERVDTSTLATFSEDALSRIIESVDAVIAQGQGALFMFAGSSTDLQEDKVEENVGVLQNRFHAALLLSHLLYHNHRMIGKSSLNLLLRSQEMATVALETTEAIIMAQPAAESRQRSMELRELLAWKSHVTLLIDNFT